jgi:hypothetical protein
MPRQNYLSKESFVDASEKHIKETLLSIPAFASNIKLVGENKLVESIRFSYDLPVKKMHYYINVSVLPLNEQYTRISLHATYINGQAFHSISDVNIALHDFESAIQAALKGDTSSYVPYKPKEVASKKMLHLVVAFVSSLGVFFLKKKLS